MDKIGPNIFMAGGGVCGRGETGGAFCSVCIFHNQKIHVYLISISLKFISPLSKPFLTMTSQVPYKNLNSDSSCVYFTFTINNFAKR